MERGQTHVGGSKRFYFDLTLLKRFLRLSKVLFPSFLHLVTLLFFFILALSLLEQYVIYNIGLVPSKFYKILGDKDRTAFSKGLTIAILLILSEAFIKSTITYVTNVLYITWRQCVSTYIHTRYFKDIIFYKVNVVHKIIDNPDQRITQDVDKMCNTLSQVLAPLIISPFTIGYYIHQAAAATGYIGPVSVVCFFIIATVINKFLMSPVIDYFYRQEKMEGDFRFKHMQMRVYSEAVAFYRSGSLEKEKTNVRLNNLIETQHKLIRREYLLKFFTNVCDYLGSILSYIALSIPIFTGRYDDLTSPELAALISKNAFVCIYLISRFTKLIDLSSLAVDVGGTAHRISELLEHLGAMEDERSASYDFLEEDGPHEGGDGEAERQSLIVKEVGIPPDSNPSNEHQERMAVSVQNVTYGPPNSRNIFCKGLNLEFTSKRCVLITGDSGCGKSSLLRVINGIWSSLSGSVTRHVSLGPRGIFFLPQLPYFTDGSLREQVIYPLKLSSNESVSGDDEVILENLSYAGLSHLLDRVGDLDTKVEWSWYNELSPGEMQRLSFVRLFYHKPPFAVLDESTSQIGHDAEHEMYKRCCDLGIAFISVSHRESLRQYHDLIVHMKPGSRWTLQSLTPQGEGDA